MWIPAFHECSHLGECVPPWGEVGLLAEALLWTPEHSSMRCDWLSKSSFHFGRDLRTISGRLLHVMGLTTSWMSLWMNLDSTSGSALQKGMEEQSREQLGLEWVPVLCCVPAHWMVVLRHTCASITSVV